MPVDADPGVRIRASRLRVAELLSSVGAAVVGAGVGALTPDRVRSLALPALLVGVLLHVVGMSAKHRLQAGEPRASWVVAAYWLCLALLAALFTWAVGRYLW